MSLGSLRSRLIVRLVAALLVPSMLALPAVLPIGEAHAADRAGVVGQAREAFDNARFEDAIAVLKPALDAHRLSGTDLVAGLELLARSYVRIGKAPEAVNTYYALLGENDKWVPDPDRVSDEESAAFSDARTRWQALHHDGSGATAKSHRTLWMTGGGAAAAVLVAVLLPKKSATSTKAVPLGSPPPPPQ